MSTAAEAVLLELDLERAYRTVLRRHLRTHPVGVVIPPRFA